ncbi:MAG: hypothetical protein ACLQJL_04915 [Roseiarcus sp.]
MFDVDEKPIRFHLTEDFVLDSGERVFLDRLEGGTSNWVRRYEVPEDKKTPHSLQALVCETALTLGGEAWRAMTERGELLRVFSVYDPAKEWSNKIVLTMHPSDQFFLGAARARLMAEV